MTQRWQTLPLRVRLVTLGVVGLLIGFTIGGATLVWALHVSLQRSVDSAATRTAQDIAGLVEQDRLPDPITTGRDSTIVQIFDADGRFVRGSLGADPLVPLLPDAQLVEATRGRHFTVDGDRAGMHGTLRATAERAGDLTVVVAVSQSELAAVPKLAYGLTITLGVLVAAVTALLWWMVGRTLAPVEAARAKQRAFVADAAHELRSPLANMRTELEVAERIGAPDELIRDLLTDVERLSRMTEDLLLLSRLDDGRPWRPEDIDVRQFLAGVVAEYSDARVAVAMADIGDDTTEPVVLRIDHDGLLRILTNLVDNAVRHANTTVTVACRIDGDNAVVEVADDGPGIPLADRGRVFDRFTRLDNARSRDAGGTGLGLSIVSEMVAVQHGTVRLTDADPHGLRAIVTLPMN